MSTGYRNGRLSYPVSVVDHKKTLIDPQLESIEEVIPDEATAQNQLTDEDSVTASLALKAEKSEMSVTIGTGADADKTTITLKEGVSATVLNAHQDISGKADAATTLAGYGITDAKIEGGVITLGTETITPLTEHQDISGKVNTVDAEALFAGTITAEQKKQAALQQVVLLEQMYGYEVSTSENPEYTHVIVDSEDRIIAGKKVNGNIVLFGTEYES